MIVIGHKLRLSVLLGNWAVTAMAQRSVVFDERLSPGIRTPADRLATLHEFFGRKVVDETRSQKNRGGREAAPV
ncbi:MAG: hypothetical protein ACKOEG_04390 [Chthoniobacterales bacterium]